MKKFLVFIGTMISLSGYGQELDPYKFTSVVDLYEFPTVGATGNLDAQLPLYTIKTRDFELPLSLNYDQMGNSNVFYIGNQFGDAWVLNAIGTISREIGNERSILATNLTGEIRCGVNDRLSGHFSARRLRIGPYIPDEQYYQSNVNVKYNLTPDHYTFSFMGLNGKFTIYNDNGILKPQLLESSDFAKIEIVQPASWELINTIYIYDKNGYKYKFSSPSNINQNNYHESMYHNQDLYLLNECRLFTYFSGHSLAPTPGGDGTGTQIRAGSLISRQIFSDGKPFWRNLELTEIYDKDNILLVNYEYDSVGVANADHANRWVNGLGLFQSYQKLFVKKINIAGQGTITFNNALASNNSNVVNSYTNSIDIKDLKNNLIKTITFDFVNKEIHNIPYVKDYKDESYGLSFQKRLLTGVKEYNNTGQSFLHTTIDYKDPYLNNINNTNVVIDRYGFLTKVGYCQHHLSAKDYRANTFMLQKIKYPTGGAVVYEFEPNTFSHSMGITNYQDHNYDNHVYQSLPLTQLSDGVTFNANEGDRIFVLNKSTSTSLLLYKTIGTNQLIKNGFNNKEGLRFLTGEDCKHLLPNLVLPASDDGKYTFKYSSGYTSAANIVVYKLNYNSTNYNFRYAEGNRIAKTAYFKDNVTKTILNTPTGEVSAEKVVTFDYSDPAQTNTSSGRVRLSYVNDLQLRPFSVLYGEVITNIRGIGKHYSKYNFPTNFWEESIRTDVTKSKLYNVSNQLVSETNYDYSYGIPPVNMTAFTDQPKPFISSLLVNIKNYEGASFTSATSSSVFDSNRRQVVSQITEDNLGKVNKTEFDYDVKGNKIVNTNVRNYVDNSLTDQMLNTYDVAGNLTKTEFKTPDMSVYEQTGMVAPIYFNGLLRGYTQLDGRPVTLVYGYSNTKLVAKMINVDPLIYYNNSSYLFIRSNISSHSNQSGLTYNETNLKSTLNSLRTTFPNALITTYTYKPMVGVSSVTDENGKTTTYEYDTFNRLATVKDYLGNILKEYQYNFTN